MFDEDPKAQARKLNYLRLKELLVHLGMISEAGASSDSQERALLFDLWKLLRGEEAEEVAASDVQLVVMAVLRMSEGHKRAATQKRPEEPGVLGYYNEQR